jgi:hypothetical protein
MEAPIPLMRPAEPVNLILLEALPVNDDFGETSDYPVKLVRIAEPISDAHLLLQLPAWPPRLPCADPTLNLE